jgi:hypothetical protein
VALDLIEELDGLLAQFAREGVEYALCGGLALAIHKRPRHTDDIDVLVPPDGVDAATRAARAIGFDIPGRRMIFGLAEGKRREIQRISKLDPDTGELLTLDLIVVEPELQSVWDTRVVGGFRGRDIVVVSREGLVTMKRIAGRDQDLVDITALETPDDQEA